MARSQLCRPADAQPATQLRNHSGVIRHPAGYLVTAVEQSVSERNFALLETPILDGPYGSVTLDEADDRRFRGKQGLRQPYRGDVDLGLFAEIEFFRHTIERDFDPALLVDAIALRLDAHYLSLQAYGPGASAARFRLARRP